MTVDYYYTAGSAPCRCVLLTAKAVGVELNLKPTNLMKGEHLTPEFLKLNPQHTVPTLVDDGLVLTESRAIMCYLANKYAKDDSLYPKDPAKRAMVDSRLYFDMGTLYARFGDLYYPMLFGGASYDEEKAKKLDEALGFLDGFLAKTAWVAGDNMTIADFCLAASVSTFEVVGVNLAKHANVTKWLQKCKTTMPGYKEANQEGVEAFEKAFCGKLKK
ncbi:glutathione S-transferase 1-like [Cimex lectularius]|uniref:Glutathione S-transferase n=1 Tax=Cimex lectularius TaxID=79782 RepID=A0A8I6S758_CIMLE|nr:glutathione S-transferase 1-like [Cimex lectularius]